MDTKTTPQSMTGFARTSGHIDRYRWAWELRSVNGKSLDVRLRLPSGFDQFEADIRKQISNRFSRGSMQVSLSMTLSESKLELVVNEPALKAVLDLQERLGDLIDPTPMTVDRLLNIRGIADFREAEDSAEKLAERDADIRADFARALDLMTEMRCDEGRKITSLLTDQINQIAALTQAIEDDPSRSPQFIMQRLSEQLARLTETTSGLEPARLHAEAALLATKADLREELDRLVAHIAAARALLASGGPCGRRLDFLAQEFNRETNTICSKSNSVSITAAGLELKTVIDQFREQLQNLE